ncbi:hypothetical protein HK102_004217, partial [Quaeritorhiza haematococci]
MSRPLRMMLVAAVAASAVNAAPTPVAVPLTDFQSPSQDLAARFAVPTQGKTSMIDLHLRTNVPSINLDNLEDVQNVQCSENQVTVTLGDASKAEQWVSDRSAGLLLLINPRWKCHGSESAVFRVATTVSVTDANTAVFTTSTEKPALSTLIDDFDLSLSQKEDDYNGGFDFQWEPGLNVPIGKDPVHGLSAVCANCYVKGNTYVHLNVTGKIAGFIPKIKLDLSGTLNSNFDVVASVEEHFEPTESNFELYKFNFEPISVAGLVRI